MKKGLIVIVFFLIVINSFAQNGTVSQLESKWQSLYKTGIAALEKQDYTKAEESFRTSVAFLEQNNLINNTIYVRSLIKLGETYFAMSQSSNASMVKERILGFKRTIQQGSKRYIEYLLDLGGYYQYLGQYNEAIASYDEALSFKETLSLMDGYASKLLHQKAYCLYCAELLGKATITEEQCVRSDENKTPDYIKSLAYYYFKDNNWNKLEEVLPNAFVYSRESILRMFSQSQTEERNAFWSSVGSFFTDFIPTFAVNHPSDVLVSYAYDAALFGKGVLLAADIKSNELTLDSDDPELIKLYSHYQELKRKKERSISEEVEIESLSKVLLRYQKEHKYDFRKDFRINWMDIRDRLKEDDIAIEFISIPQDGKDELYFAVSIKKGYVAPHLTKLASYKELSSIRSRQQYTTSRLYNLIWEPLEPELTGVNNVYFSPTGILYNTGIEFIPDADGELFCSGKNTYRLSSTKELVRSKKRPLQEGILFGGLDYDADPSLIAQQSTGHPVKSSLFVSIDSLQYRGAAITSTFCYLPGTLEEVQDISRILNHSKISVNLFTGSSGSESAFKDLTETSADFLHIATHGFYFNNKTTGYRIKLDSLFKKSVIQFSDAGFEPYVEDKMLTRSGLVMAGGNNSINNSHKTDSIEDGLLLAGEIANLNFSNINLLVLSACQSGLGDISSSEGVFGLQRGFKLAGVQSIVMSLWEVSDDATKIMMTRFYEYISAGKGKYESFKEAQDYLRMYDDGLYDDPDYYAAFILLDALN